MRRLAVVVLATALAVSVAVAAKSKPKNEEPESKLSASTFAGLAFRSIGPAVTSGRVSDVAVQPDGKTWYVTAASGGVWKTSNAGTTWAPVFDDQGSYSIGCVALDPGNPDVVWIGTGENNSQRSVSYGDGVYKSIDAGRSWKKVGLDSSEHVGRIAVDPRDSQVVFVAAQGPLWNPGGDRGLYKTTDGGETWERVLAIDDDTGVTDVVFRPDNPDVLLAASYQRRRHVWTLINGGPGSGIHKSTDGGRSWREVETGLPKVDLGRIGLAVAPSAPGVVYAFVEAAEGESGFYRSGDFGETWTKQSDYVSGSGQYYNEIFVDPDNPDRVYAVDTWLHVTDDAGKNFRKVGGKYRHVDDHAIWIDPADSDHLLVGCDGGLYETHDRGATWDYVANLPITQFYKGTVDNSEPFYYVYGGTQDNFTLGGPSRTTNTHGIRNSDWFVTVGGDGFEPQADPTDPNIVYSQSQYGGLVRHDRRSGEILDIQPQPGPGDPPLRWNWDSPLLISPHSPSRLYFAAQRVFRSDDRGNSWRPFSPDLTRQRDRNTLEVMGRVWSVDAVAKNDSTSFYGNIVALAESPLVEGLLYAGTDDGLVQVTADAGATWRRAGAGSGVPEYAYVPAILPSRHDADTVYAAFENHKSGDYRPYLLRSTDRGRTWASIAGDLPERGSVLSLEEDPVRPELLFAGTEFGAYFTLDGGKRWIELSGGLPTIAVRDLEIQEREGDLVAFTFGRGFYVLDDYSPLRGVSESLLEKEGHLFSVKDARMYVEATPLALPEKAFQGDSFFTAPNPPFGAVFTYYLRDDIESLEKRRRRLEKKKAEKGEDTPYPSWEALREEDRERDPVAILTVTDEDGGVVRRIAGPVTKGFNRVAWDLRYPASNPTSLTPPPTDNPFAELPTGPLASPGRYSVSLALEVRGETRPIGEPKSFDAVPLGNATLPASDREALLAFQKKTGRLQRATLGAVRAVAEAGERVKHLRQALIDTPHPVSGLLDEVDALEAKLADVEVELTGDSTVARRNEPTPPSLVSRVQRIVYGHWSTTTEPTATHRRNYEIAAESFAPLLEKLRGLVEDDLAALEARAEKAGAPWTPGRVPRWSPE